MRRWPWPWWHLHKTTVAPVLVAMTLRDYRLRMDGRRPDRLYWADALLCRWGLFLRAPF